MDPNSTFGKDQEQGGPPPLRLISFCRCVGVGERGGQPD